VKIKDFFMGHRGIVNSHLSFTDASIRYNGELYNTFILDDEIERVGGILSLKAKSTPKIVVYN
jgi:hypothetical protein